jgi:hypothetical protein
MAQVRDEASDSSRVKAKQLEDVIKPPSTRKWPVGAVAKRCSPYPTYVHKQTATFDVQLQKQNQQIAAANLERMRVLAQWRQARRRAMERARREPTHAAGSLHELAKRIHEVAFKEEQEQYSTQGTTAVARLWNGQHVWAGQRNYNTSKAFADKYAEDNPTLRLTRVGCAASKAPHLHAEMYLVYKYFEQRKANPNIAWPTHMSASKDICPYCHAVLHYLRIDHWPIASTQQTNQEALGIPRSADLWVNPWDCAELDTPQALHGAIPVRRRIASASSASSASMANSTMVAPSSKI